MNAPTRLAAFAVLLAVVFGGSLLAGSAIDPTDDPPAAHDGGHADDAATAMHPGGTGRHDSRDTLRGGEPHPADHPASEVAPR